MKTRGRWDSPMSGRGGLNSNAFAANGKTIPPRQEEQKTPDATKPPAADEKPLSAETIIRGESYSHPQPYWQALLLFPENLNY